MADRSASDRTEAPTPERLRRARQEGQVPHSQELPTALILVALMGALAMTAGNLWQWSTAQAREGLMLHRPASLDIESVTHLLHGGILGLLTILAPFFVLITVASVLGCVLVSGLVVSPKALQWKFDRLLPSTGLQALFSPKSGVQLVVALVKFVVLGTLAYAYLHDKLGDCLALSAVTPLAAATVIFEMVFGLLARVAVALTVIAVLDSLYQRWQWRRNLRMTRQEVKEERRSHEGSPHAKNRILSIHFGMLRKRMLKDVPKADVVVVNPTHVAVALQYDAASMQAPVAVAKGADHLCEKIKELARRHHIPILEKPELARTLYSTVEVGQPIPETLYVAVAEILATIYRLRHAR
jgi:flagellar biosynthesis protein FlhB